MAEKDWDPRVLAQKKMASEEKKSDEQTEEKIEKKKHRGIPEALFLVSLTTEAVHS